MSSGYVQQQYAIRRRGGRVTTIRAEIPKKAVPVPLQVIFLGTRMLLAIGRSCNLDRWILAYGYAKAHRQPQGATALRMPILYIAQASTPRGKNREQMPREEQKAGRSDSRRKPKLQNRAFALEELEGGWASSHAQPQQISCPC